MASWESVDINHDETVEEYDKWDDGVMNDTERRLNQLKQFNKTLDESRDEDLIYMTTTTRNALNKATIQNWLQIKYTIE